MFLSGKFIELNGGIICNRRTTKSKIRKPAKDIRNQEESESDILVKNDTLTDTATCILLILNDSTQCENERKRKSFHGITAPLTTTI